MLHSRTQDLAADRASDGLAVYLHGDLLGFIVERCGGCDAISATGQHLGRFTSHQAATTELLARAVGFRDGVGG